jgi:hypothetical protein
MLTFIDVADWLARLWALAFITFILWLVYGETRRSIARALQRRDDVRNAQRFNLIDPACFDPGAHAAAGCERCSLFVTWSAVVTREKWDAAYIAELDAS